MTFTLFRVIRSVEEEASASNDVRVTYEKPIVEIVAGGKSYDECKAELKKIEEEVRYYKSLNEKKQEIYTAGRNKSRSWADEKIYKLEEQIKSEKNPYVEKLYIGYEGFWEAVRKRTCDIEIY